MLLLMYADDTVLFATTKPQLQNSLNKYAKYCNKWKLNVNVDKTKIIIFGRRKRHTFTLNNKNIEVVDTFKYLGVIFNRNGKFIDAIKDNINKARLAMYTLRHSFKEKCIPIDCQIDIFEKNYRTNFIIRVRNLGVPKYCSDRKLLSENIKTTFRPSKINTHIYDLWRDRKIPNKCEN